MILKLLSRHQRVRGTWSTVVFKRRSSAAILLFSAEAAARSETSETQIRSIQLPMPIVDARSW